MTYASEMFAWYAGSPEADTYFCPERHGMYFGGFGMKTAPAMGKQNYSISTSLTGDSGEAFLSMLATPQRKLVTDLVDLQRKDLDEIVTTRRAIAAELQAIPERRASRQGAGRFVVEAVRRTGRRVVVLLRHGLREGRQDTDGPAEREAVADAQFQPV